jgi:hypothetical protein
MRRRGALSLCAVFAVTTIAACRDLERGVSANPQPAMPPSVQLALEPRAAGDSSMVVGVRLVGLDSPSVVSLTAEVVYDTTRVRFAFDGSPDDGALRAVNASRGRVMLAVAHATGLTGDVAARLRFIARDTSAFESMALTVRELHRRDATDARQALTLSPPRVNR